MVHAKVQGRCVHRQSDTHGVTAKDVHQWLSEMWALNKKSERKHGGNVAAGYSLDADVIIWLLRSDVLMKQLPLDLSLQSISCCSALTHFQVEAGMSPKEEHRMRPS